MLNIAELMELTFTLMTKAMCKFHMEKMLSGFPEEDKLKIIITMLDELPNEIKTKNIDDKAAVVFKRMLCEIAKRYETKKGINENIL